MISDLIRVIVCTYHPSNKKLASSIVPRYQVIAWLLKCTRTNVAAGDAKLALYIDWFTFASNADVMCGGLDISPPLPHPLPLSHAGGGWTASPATLR